MHRFVARANIDHDLSILNSDVILGAEKRAAIVNVDRRRGQAEP